MKKLFAIVAAFAVLITSSSAFAEVRLPKTFTDNAVLQRDLPIRVWGWADPGEEVTVTFSGATVSTTACAQGKWLVSLPAFPASFEPQQLVVSGKTNVGTNTVTFNNILVGEVWVCSGQSNMEMPLNSWGQPGLACTDEEISGDYSFIRFNRPAHVVSNTELDDLTTEGWKVCKDGVQKDCTATGFHFAVRLNKELNVPVGLIDSNWGGSAIHSWIPDAGWNQIPETIPMGQEVLKNRDEAEAWAKAGGMYNAMLAPWTKYTIRGAIWYQGCSDAGIREGYYFKQKAMIREWRKVWGLGDFPFYWVELASFTEPKEDPNDTGDWPGLRNGQTMCLEVANTGQAVIIDAGEEKDIHPRNKFVVGNRLALWALAHTFNKDLDCCSPMFKELKVDGNKAIVTMDHVGGGLVVGQQNNRDFSVVENGKLAKFAIAGEDGKFVWADANIVNPNTIELTSPEVANPVSVRYAWQMNPVGCNLYSAEGLPANPFEAKVQ